jgi:hypothetical protein
MNNDDSVASAKRCIESGQKYGLDIDMFPAFTPEDNPRKMMENKGMYPLAFDEKYSRPENAMAAFLSHHALWEAAAASGETHIIFEHDAVLLDQFPMAPFKYVINYGAPSYGKFTPPRHFGVGPLTSKPYFPGAHAYGVRPSGAELLMIQAVINPMPTDIFLNVNSFPWLEEHYPFIAEARDSFTTIQNINGCLAKHNYGKDFRIIDA